MLPIKGLKGLDRKQSRMSERSGTAPATLAADEPTPGMPRLDDLVTRVAVELMPVTAASLDDALAWTLRTLTDFLRGGHQLPPPQ